MRREGQEHGGGPGIGFEFEAIGVIAVPKTFPEVPNGENVDALKLMNVSDLVQEQHGIELRVWREEHGASEGNAKDGAVAKRPSTNARRDPAATPKRTGKCGMTREQRLRQRKRSADHRATGGRPPTCQRPSRAADAERCRRGSGRGRCACPIE